MKQHVKDTEVEVPSGRFIDMANPDPRLIVVEDLGWKLAQVNRYAGSAYYPYSVATHAVFVSRRVEQKGGDLDTQMAALHHDDAEAFLMDIPRPVKPLYGPQFRLLVENFDRVIWQALDLPLWPKAPGVKEADSFALYVEARHLLPSKGLTWRAQLTMDRWGVKGLPQRIITPDYWRGEIDWRTSRDEYLARHQQLLLRMGNGIR